MITLGIETSCDETALSLIETRSNNGNLECRVISSLINSQAELHSQFGGVFPTLAKREHGRNLLPLLKKLFEESKSEITSDIASIPEEKFQQIIAKFRDEFYPQNPDLFDSFESTGIDFLRNIPRIDRIAVTEGPGLEPALWVGINFARIISALWSIPLIPVNHMEGHIVGSLLNTDIPNGSWQTLKHLEFPAVALLISGGHTELIKINNDNNDTTAKSDLSNTNSDQLGLNYTILGQTRDDAVGEAFDKSARLIGLPYPGGPHISKLSAEAREKGIVSNIKLPRPMLHSHDLNFSFSGLKTAVLYAVRDNTGSDNTLTEEFKMGLARELEEAIRDTLSAKLKDAIDEIGAQTIIIGGGVSANTMLRNQFTEIAQKHDLQIFLPSQHVSGDNALMIALAGALDIREHTEKLKANGTKRLGDY